MASVLHAHLGDTPRGARVVADRRRQAARDSRLVLEAGLWAALGQSALLIGALLVARFPKLTEPRWLGLVMAFGAGALISAITTDLVVPAYHAAGRAPAGIGLLVGAVGYYALTTWLNAARRAGRPRGAGRGGGGRRRRRGVARRAPTRPRPATSPSAWCSTASPSRSPSASPCSAGARCRSRWSARCSSPTCPTPSASPPRCSPAAIELRKVLLRFGGDRRWSASSPVSPGTRSSSPTEADLIAIIQTIAAGAMIVVVRQRDGADRGRGAGRHAGLGAAAGFAVAAFL